MKHDGSCIQINRSNHKNNSLHFYKWRESTRDTFLPITYICFETVLFRFWNSMSITCMCLDTGVVKTFMLSYFEMQIVNMSQNHAQI